ncbi:MAG: hypothetical protein B6D61_00785 [Bacteroidetes bacterium 4484_249]|nr:MAG: hypothetical protein B6D61_00785 [Bacteroidetes bacterium 4484_249]
MRIHRPLKQFIIAGLVLASTSIFSQSDAMMDTVCAGSQEYYKVLKTEGSTYEWEISSGGKALYGVDTKSDSVMIEWTTTDVFTEEYVKVTETNKYGRSGDPVQLNIIKYPVPTAIISGTDTLFDGNTGTNKIKIALTGTSPWSIVYNDGSNDIDIKGIESSPFTLETRSLSNPPEIHKFTLVSIKNESGCAGEVSGVAEITVSPPIKTSKIFHK